MVSSTRALHLSEGFAGNKGNATLQFCRTRDGRGPVSRLQGADIKVRGPSGTLLKEIELDLISSLFIQSGEGLIDLVHLPDGIDTQMGESGMGGLSIDFDPK